jgi:hypothetical protein
MRPLPKGIIVALIAFALVVLIFVPFIAGPAAACNPHLLCIPDQRESVTKHFLGFGGESSFGVWPYSRFYSPW